MFNKIVITDSASAEHHLMINSILQAKVLIENNKKKGIVENLEEVEFKVYSQWGDDGIIQYLINIIDIPNKTFIEFGVENYKESNTRFLLINNNWSGLVMDGSESNMQFVQNDEIYWKYDLQCKHAFVTSENINELISSPGFEKEVGILHIDIDGNDYWVWKAINVIDPIIIIIEYNSMFGYDKSLTIPYSADFQRTNYHYSNLLYGSSLLSLCDLANEKGYKFIGCNSAGNNAYFVRNDKIGNLRTHTPQSGYRISKFKESRNKDGKLTFCRFGERINLLKGSKVYNTRTNLIEEF